MTITRIFRVRIHPELREEFERKFASVSIAAVADKEGAGDVQILRPSRWASDEYAMISQWEDEASLAAFAGENWNTAVIPPGMDKYVIACGVHHYSSWTGEESGE
ncbi:antibiotic biosynthesis monooxygenase family protein [Altererythrobacter sp. H2]|uniref:antibiotic biosynthesis monooxygenase family protein n=1 Tax=Altererythrobacter sp. H2 TaxID=3108391 RepID=UPI002B4C2318|nr:antibiotic biosynthesis monooxygenase family protein [Altererythrobacter sp. H2]WRK96847.1 antibiotic biosynthesis monooxygenase family protein [Altererythrobacter sp. H2]